MGLIIAFRSILGQVADSRISKLRSISGVKSTNLHRSTWYISCNTVHFRLHIIHVCSLESNQRATLLQSSTDQGTNNWRYLFSGLELNVRYDRRVVDLNMHRNHFLIQQFVCPCTHNSKTIGHMWMFYISNDCCTIGGVYFLF